MPSGEGGNHPIYRWCTLSALFISRQSGETGRLRKSDENGNLLPIIRWKEESVQVAVIYEPHLHSSAIETLHPALLDTNEAIFRASGFRYDLNQKDLVNSNPQVFLLYGTPVELLNFARLIERRFQSSGYVELYASGQPAVWAFSVFHTQGINSSTRLIVSGASFTPYMLRVDCTNTLCNPVLGHCGFFKPNLVEYF